MTVTFEQIEEQFRKSPMLRMALNSMLKQLKKIETEGGEEAKQAAIAVIKGQISLNDVGKEEALKRCGMKAKMSLSALSNLTTAQRQYILVKLGWEQKQ